MIVIRTRSTSDGKEILRKLKKMYKFTKELLECAEECYDEDYEYDDEVDYHYDDEGMHERRMRNARSSEARYRRSRM